MIGPLQRHSSKVSLVIPYLLFIILSISTIIQGHKGLQITNISLLIMICCALVYIFQKERVFFDRSILAFCVIILILTSILAFQGSTYFSPANALKSIVYLYSIIFIVLVISSSKDHYQKMWKCVNSITKVAMVIVLVQSLLYFIWGVQYYIAFDGSVSQFLTIGSGLKYRPSAFFSEPSHFAEFVLLSYYYYLFVKQNYKIIFIYSLGIIASTSGLGIVGAAILWAIYVCVYKPKHSFSSYKYILFFGRVMIILIVIYLFIFFYSTALESDYWLLQRLASGGTFDARVLRSFDIYFSLGFFNKIFGVGLQNQANYLEYFSFVSQFDNRGTLINREYAQTLGYILTTTGLIGFISFNVIWLKIAMKNKNTRILIGLFLFVCLVSNVLTRFIMMLYMIMIYKQYNKKVFKPS